MGKKTADNWITDKYEIDRIKTYANEAIDFAQRILKECDLNRACVSYIREKAEDLKWCAEYFLSSCKEAEQKGEGE